LLNNDVDNVEVFDSDLPNVLVAAEQVLEDHADRP
jgi:hypothetical protein